MALLNDCVLQRAHTFYEYLKMSGNDISEHRVYYLSFTVSFEFFMDTGCQEHICIRCNLECNCEIRLVRNNKRRNIKRKKFHP